MIEEVGNIWDRYDAGHIICVTTNGYVNQKGMAVMGRGVAKQASDRFPNLPSLHGQFLRSTSDWAHVYEILPRLVIFPVKRDAGPPSLGIIPHLRNRYACATMVPGFALLAELSIIGSSLVKLRSLALLNSWNTVYLPRPGCGAGGLSWEAVRPLCIEYGEWLHVITI